MTANTTATATWVARSVYDLNGDAAVSISDVTALLDHLAFAVEYDATYDLSGDGSNSISDATELLNILAGN